ncbi:MAG TPA: type II secretion system protein [Burkholderiales bacterium]|nr:type II secretion system protein [Burkholderiales bacterium]
MRGFTLVELAIASLVMGLILSGILVPLSRQVETRQKNDSQRILDETREALIGYALSKGYLPCPATSVTNGQEGARTAGTCNSRRGLIPWETLGVAKLDAWGNILGYSVTPAFASSTVPFSLSTSPDITIQTRTSGTAALSNLTNSNTVVAAIISFGPNGYGGYNDQAVLRANPSDWPASNTDENSNTTNTNSFVSRDRQDQGATGIGGEFDDVVVWLPAYTLFQRMVTAKMLP